MYLMLLDPSNKPVTAAGTVEGYLVIGPLPAGTSTIGKVDQGLGGASAWKVDGSAVTQPVSGNLGADLRVAAAAVTAGNPVHVAPGTATTWAVSSDAAQYRARTPTSAVATATVALQQLSAIVTPAITTHLNFRLCVPDTADTGVYLGTSTHQTLLLPGREFAIDSTSLVGWYIKRGGGADVIVTIFGLLNT